MGFNVAIDGPAGAGKSTIAKKIASDLNFIYVDTGAMYRAIGYYLMQNHVELNQEKAVEEALPHILVELGYEDGVQQVYLNGENVSGKIRTQEIGEAASKTSAYPSVRAKLLELQQTLAAKENVLMDGRDIGTCVLPNADVKIFLTADVEVRAERRYKELIEKGQVCDLKEIEKEIADRDYRDMHREISPLKKAEDAVEVNTSSMGIDEVVETIEQLIRNKQSL